jgi:hypothetical protein
MTLKLYREEPIYGRICRCGCGRVIVRHKWESAARFNARPYFERACYSPPVEIVAGRFCKCGCGEELIPEPRELEHKREFNRRLFVNREHYHRWNKGREAPRLSNGWFYGRSELSKPNAPDMKGETRRLSVFVTPPLPNRNDRSYMGNNW